METVIYKSYFILLVTNNYDSCCHHIEFSDWWGGIM